MLIYTGKGDFVVNIPARDLSDEEVKAFGGEKSLLATGLYAKSGASKPPRPPSGWIDLADGVSDAEATLGGQTLRKERDEKQDKPFRKRGES